MPSLKQTSAAGGIVSQQLLGRSDQQRYVSGFRVLRNAIVTRYGTVENRTGTEYVGTATNPTEQNRLIKFVFNNQVAYLLEFSDGYIVPYRNGARISTVGAPAYAGGTSYILGNVVTSVGITYVCIQAGTGHTPASSPTFWFALAGDKLVIPSAILQAMLGDFQTVQQNDVMTIVEQAVHPQVLTRFSDTQWTFAPFLLTTGISPPSGVGLSIGVGPSTLPAAPTGLVAIGGVAATPKDNYLVTAFLQGSGAGSQSAVSATAQSSDGKATVGTPVVLAWNASAVDGYAVYKLNAINGTYGIIALVPALVSPTWTDRGEFNSGLPPGDPITVPTCVRSAPLGTPGNITFRYVVTAVDALTGAESLASAEASATGRTPTEANPNIISWSSVSGAGSYRIYSIVGGVPGFIGTTTEPTTAFPDKGYTPDTVIQPPAELDLFATSDDYPAVVGYYQQRIGFANTISVPTQVNLSRVGNPYNFTVSAPVQDDDAVSFSIAGQRNNSVQHLIDLGKLIIHTAGSEYVANGNINNAITPLGIGLVRQGSSGASSVPPVNIGNTDIFVQARGGYMRDLRYEIQSTSFAGKDMTVFAPDLLDGRTIVSMDWEQIPHPIIWAALDDGTLLGLTYSREQDLWSWHEHLFVNGQVEQVCTVPEGTTDVVYLTVKRTINGTETRYIEKIAARDFTTVEEAYFVDCGLQYDGRNTGSDTITATSVSGGWTPTDVILLTASAPTFIDPTDVGNAIVLQRLADGTTFDAYGKRIQAGTVIDEVTLNIITYLTTTTVEAVPQGTLAAWAQVALTSWGKAVRAFSGLDHLEGESISVLADGNVAASPLALNPDGTQKYPDIIVTAGAFALTDPALIVSAGLPMQTDIQTMPVENAQGETISNKQITVRECCPIFFKSRGGLFGQDPFHLREWKQPRAQPPETVVLGEPVQLWTGPALIPIQGTPQPTGQVWIRNVDPLPFGFSAITVTADVGR